MPLAIVVRREIPHPIQGRWVDLPDEETDQHERVRQKRVVFLTGIRVEIRTCDAVPDLVR